MGMASFDKKEYDKIAADPDAFVAKLDRQYQLQRAYEICKRFDKTGAVVSKVQERARALGISLNSGCAFSTNSVVANALACNRRTSRNAFGDSASVGALTTEMVKLLKQIQPIAKRLYDTAFELDDEGTYWLENNKGDKNANKTRIAVERANKVMSRIAEFVTGGI